jgi:hypothetical protein
MSAKAKKARQYGIRIMAEAVFWNKIGVCDGGDQLGSKQVSTPALPVSRSLLIAIAGPYNAPTPEGRQRNHDALNAASAAVLRAGHIPVLGVNAALAIVERAQPRDPYDALMRISLALVERCDGVLFLGPSPGATRERDLIAAAGKPVYTRIEDLPPAPPYA